MVINRRRLDRLPNLRDSRNSRRGNKGRMRGSVEWMNEEGGFVWWMDWRIDGGG